MSKFDYDVFIGDKQYLGVSKEKYTREQAINVAIKEEFINKENCIYLANGYVRFGYGTDEDGEHRSTWWLEFNKPKKGCKVWCFCMNIYNYEEEFYEKIEIDNLLGEKNERS